ncbi:MAG: sterol desaturase family protein [Planctomycetales bacterium]|nr:sterol desaturase family protein [Planctomycetales bacterium]
MSEPSHQDSPDEVRLISRADGGPVAFGSGWISGVLGILFSGLGLFTVLCIQFPSWLTIPELRGYYTLPTIRALLHIALVSGFLLGLTSLTLRKQKILGSAALTCSLAAALMGGAQVNVDTNSTSSLPVLSLDWFMLNLIFWCAVFVPLERCFALRRDQPIFRHGWRTDLTYFFVSTLAVQWVTIMTLKPAQVLFAWVVDERWRFSIGSQPLPVQIAEILLLTDFVQYWIHRAFHRIPWLWRFHAIHHSAEKMDWLAGSRLHLIDIVLTRGLTYMPLFVLGFIDTALLAYGVIVTLQATFIHANLRFTFGPLRYWIVTPQFHHWHHSDQAEAIDKNFAVHLPIWDWLFGSFHLPGKRWPQSYGIDGAKPTEGFLRQFFWPFS